MSNIYAVIENGIVVNKVLADAEFAQSQGWIPLPEGVDIGWSYDGNKVTPPVVVESVVSEPSKEQLLAELQALTAKIQALE